MRFLSSVRVRSDLLPDRLAARESGRFIRSFFSTANTSFSLSVGVKPSKETRPVNLVSLESLIITLVELKQQRVSRDQIQKTFENAAYSFLIPQRCPFHQQIELSHCSVVRCHAGAKLLSAYLNQLYPPQRSSSRTENDDDDDDEITRLQREDFHRLLSSADSIASSSERSTLTERRQVLLNALRKIDKQIDELEIE